MRCTGIAALLTVTLAVATPASGQVTHVEGSAAIDGGLVRTAGGRVEMRGPGGSMVHIDAATSVRMDPGAILTLTDGRIVVRSAGAAVIVLAPYARITLEPSGVYSVLADADSGRLLVRVVMGVARLQTEYGSTTPIGAGQLAMMTSATTIPWAAAFEPGGWDAFDAWSDARASAYAATGAWVVETTSRRAGQGREPDTGWSGGCRGLLVSPGPCWWIAGATVNRPHPGYTTPSLPNYAPTYAPSYTPPPGWTGPQAPSPGPLPLPSATPAPPPPPATSTPPARGRARAIRVPERPDLQ